MLAVWHLGEVRIREHGCAPEAEAEFVTTSQLSAVDVFFLLVSLPHPAFDSCQQLIAPLNEVLSLRLS